MLKAAARMQEIAPFYVMALLARARELEVQGKSIVHMEIGEPDFSTPQPIIAAGIEALKAGATHYTPALGMPALREALAQYYRERHALNIDAQTIIITPGSSGALQLAIDVIVNPGDEVLLTDPGYPCNKHFVQLAGGKSKFIALSQQNKFQITLEQVKQHWTSKTRAILLASPANPTGEVIDFEVLLEIAKFAKAHDGFLLIDEIYQGLEYDVSLKSMAGQMDNIFVINSFSKYFCMTGWRIGWLVAPKNFVNDIDKLAQNLFLATPTVSQHAALAAFLPETLEILEGYRESFEQRRNYLFQALQDIGFGIGDKPKGAFYIYADSQKFADDSYSFCFDLLEHAGVAITPGKDFSQNYPERFVRFAYTREIPVLEKGIAQLKQFLSR